MGIVLRLIGASAAVSLLLYQLAPHVLVHHSLLWTATTLFLVLGTIQVSYTCYIYPFYLSPLRHLPQPPESERSLLFGHGGQIFKQPTGKPMLDWEQQTPHNGLIRYLHWFNRERLLVVGHKALSEVLVTKSYDFIKPEFLRNNLGRLLGIGIIFAEGDEHKKQRRDLAPAFAFRHIKDLYPEFWSTSLEMLDAIERESSTRPSDYSHDSDVIDVGVYTSRATLDIIGSAGMGQNFSALRDPSNKLFQTYQTVFHPPGWARYFQILGLIIPGWILQRIPLKHNLQVNEAISFIRATCRERLAEKRQRLATDKATTDHDILSVAMQSGGFSEENMVDQMMTFLVAGHETTSTAMIWAIYALCEQPDLQRRLRQEIHANLPSPRTEQGRSIISTQIDSLPLLNAVCTETLRFHAPVRLTLRVAGRDTTVLDQHVPKGTIVILCPNATNNSTAQWSDDAGVFRPERWLTENKSDSGADGDGAGATVNKQGGAESNYSYLTFLHGPRSCIGQRFATAEFACLLAAWVGRYEFEFEEEGFPARMDIAGGITAKPKGGLWVRMKEVKEW